MKPTFNFLSNVKIVKGVLRSIVIDLQFDKFMFVPNRNTTQFKQVENILEKNNMGTFDNMSIISYEKFCMPHKVYSAIISIPSSKYKIVLNFLDKLNVKILYLNTFNSEKVNHFINEKLELILSYSFEIITVILDNNSLKFINDKYLKLSNMKFIILDIIQTVSTLNSYFYNSTIEELFKEKAPTYENVITNKDFYFESLYTNPTFNSRIFINEKLEISIDYFGKCFFKRFGGGYFLIDVINCIKIIY